MASNDDPQQTKGAAVTDAITPAPPQDIEMMAVVPTPTKLDDPFLVTFDDYFDADNPRDWPRGRRWTVTDVLAATGFNRIMVSTIMAPALNVIAADLHMSSYESAMALSIYLLATVFGPLFIGPLSEMYGRAPVLHASNIWFLVWNCVCGFAKTKGVLIGARFLAGFGASAIYALAGGVLGDIWRPEERGRSMAIYSLIPLLGAASGPVAGGFIAGHISWRWMFWATSIFQAVMVIASLCLFRETYGPIILKRRAKELRRSTADDRYYTTFERLDAGKSVARALARGLSRPLRLLAFHPIVQINALVGCYSYGLLYLVLTTFANLWTGEYHESTQISGLHYIGLALGEIAGAQVAGPIMDRIYKKLKTRANGETKVEFHLPIMLPGALVTPIGLLIYGWCAQTRAFWLLVDIGGFLFSMGSQFTSMGLLAYIIDAYPDHTSSASSASQVFKSLGGFTFPLFAPKLYATLGFGWGNTVLAFVWVLFSLPVPFLLWKFGPRMRARIQSSY